MSAFDVDIKVDGIEKVFSEIAMETQEVKENFVKVLWSELMDNTPLDTGTARASWDIAKTYSAIKEVSYGVQKYGSMPSIPKGSIVIGSKLDYMTFLNEGWSAQAPALFIERSVAIAYNEVK